MNGNSKAQIAAAEAHAFSATVRTVIGRLTFSDEQRFSIAQRFAKERDPDCGNLSAKAMAEFQPDASCFVFQLECVMNETKVPLWDADKSLDRVRQAAGAFNKAADLLRGLNGLEVMRVVISASEHLEHEAKVQIHAAPRNENEKYRKESLRQLEVNPEIAASWDRVSCAFQAKQRLAIFGRAGADDSRAGLYVAHDLVRDHREFADSCDTLRAFADDLALLGIAAQKVKQVSAIGIPVPDLLARRVLDVFNGKGIRTGTRNGFAADVLASMMQIMGVKGRAGTRIEKALYRKQQ